jgi:paraquat-inducible protein A
MTKYQQLLMALIFLLVAGTPAYQVIKYADLEIQILKKACNTDNLQNTANVEVGELENKFTEQHHFLGPLIAPFINRQLNLPPRKSAQKSLEEVPGLVQLVKKEAKTARLWSWGLLVISFIYFGLAFFEHKENRLEQILFSITIISVIFLLVGITAPALVILVMLPKNSVLPQCVLHFDARSVLGVITQLYSTSYWFVGVCLTIFSILIPLTKAVLTVIALKSVSLPLKLKISKFLHAIGKWSMADVFVAATILAIFAVNADKSTTSKLCIGFYYFFAYCLLSMVATTLLERRFQNVEKPIGIQ